MSTLYKKGDLLTLEDRLHNLNFINQLKRGHNMCRANHTTKLSDDDAERAFNDLKGVRLLLLVLKNSGKPATFEPRRLFSENKNSAYAVVSNEYVANWLLASMAEQYPDKLFDLKPVTYDELRSSTDQSLPVLIDYPYLSFSMQFSSQRKSMFNN